MLGIIDDSRVGSGFGKNIITRFISQQSVQIPNTVPYFLKSCQLGLIDAFLSSSEEKLFGDFLEGLAIFIAENTVGGRKSASQGIDLEFVNNDTLFLISIKSGPNWGNSSQYSALERDFLHAVRRIKQAQTKINVQPVLGICYGKSKTTYHNSYMKIMGQNFWHMISGVPNFYIDIIEPIGFNARCIMIILYERKPPFSTCLQLNLLRISVMLMATLIGQK